MFLYLIFVLYLSTCLNKVVFKAWGSTLFTSGLIWYIQFNCYIRNEVANLRFVALRRGSVSKTQRNTLTLIFPPTTLPRHLQKINDVHAYTNFTLVNHKNIRVSDYITVTSFSFVSLSAETFKTIVSWKAAATILTGIWRTIIQRMFYCGWKINIAMRIW